MGFMMRLKKNLRNIQIVFFIVLAVVLLYIVSAGIALFIQYPPVRGDLMFIFGVVSSIALLIFAFSMAMRLTKTKLSKETCFFVLLVITISISFFILANLIFKLEFPIQWIIAVSVLISTPLSCIMAGYSKKTLMDRLKKLGLNQGITIITIIILALIPIIHPFVLRIRATGYILPNLIFQNAANTSSVNGRINSSGFFAEVPIYENRTFETENIVELAIPNRGNESIDLQFCVISFMGNFELLKHLEVYLISGSERVSVVNMTNNVVYCNYTIVSLKLNNTLSLGITCTGANNLTSNETLGLSLSVFCHDHPLRKINILLKTVEYKG